MRGADDGRARGPGRAARDRPSRGGRGGGGHLVRRSDGKAIRVVTRPDGWPPHDPEREALREKVRAGTATEAEERRYAELRDERALAVLDVPEERLFDVQEVRAQAPRPAHVHASMPCANCGEMTMETRIRRSDGRNLCIPCFEQAEAR